MDVIYQILEMNKILFVTLIEFIVPTIYLSLIIYHFIIYFGRRKFSEGKYYIYFTSFISGLLLYIFTDMSTYYILIKPLGMISWTVFITAISFLIIYKSLMLLFHSLLEISSKTKKTINKVFNIYGLFNLVWLAPVIFSAIRWWLVFKKFWIVNSIFAVLLAVVYFSFVIKNRKKVEATIKIIAFVTIGFILYTMMYRAIWLINPKAPQLPYWIMNDIIKIVVAFVFAYALTQKSNKEFFDLQKLKNNLEDKVNEQTIELRLINKKIEQASQQRTNYFINLAHETKTPLTLISNYLDKYIKIAGNSKELSIIKENFNQLKNEMIQFLDIEKYEKGLVVYKHDQVINLSNYLNRKLPLFKEHAMLHDLNTYFDIENDICVKSDPCAIESIINNLFDNAVKYSNAGGEIKIVLKNTGKTAQLSVVNTGVGIEEERLEYIFNPYYQVSQPKLNKQGLGIGLFIVKNILESLNGSIKVSSKVNEITEFLISIPLEKKISANNEDVDEAMTRPKASSGVPFEPVYAGGRKNILIVEDNKHMREYLCEELNELYNVFCAENGNSALAQLKTSLKIDLILSDVMMDEMDGYLFYEKISKLEEYATIPFIFLTARSYDNEKIEMLAKGASGYLYKPFTINELKAKVQSVLINAENQRKAALKDAVNAIQNHIESPVKERSKWDIFEVRCRDYKLTSRQIEIVKLIEQGLEYKEVANKLNISVKTVHRHIQNMFENLRVHSKLELLKLLFE